MPLPSRFTFPVPNEVADTPSVLSTAYSAQISHGLGDDLNNSIRDSSAHACIPITPTKATSEMQRARSTRMLPLSIQQTILPLFAFFCGIIVMVLCLH